MAALACTLAAPASLSALVATLGISGALSLALMGSSAVLTAGAVRYLAAANAGGKGHSDRGRTPTILWMYRHIEDLMSGIIAADPLVAALLGAANPFDIYISFLAIGSLQVVRRRRLRAGHPVDDVDRQGLDEADGVMILADGQPFFGFYPHERP